jgi:hypothetical protein
MHCLSQLLMVWPSTFDMTACPLFCRIIESLPPVSGSCEIPRPVKNDLAGLPDYIKDEINLFRQVLHSSIDESDFFNILFSLSSYSREEISCHFALSKMLFRVSKPVASVAPRIDFHMVLALLGSDDPTTMKIRGERRSRALLCNLVEVGIVDGQLVRLMTRN